MKELSLKQLEEAAKEAGLDLYPKELGEGLYALAPGVISGRRGLKAFDEVMKKN
ncbi:MAG: hypothetical protein IKW84_09005 [Bacteroidaceae bacterium]|nr:hypothetical protein [Bacteroidaceae bacterium]MBR5159701.1 hypothetical protein [Bacteroidaceae bacterium]